MLVVRFTNLKHPLSLLSRSHIPQARVDQEVTPSRMISYCGPDLSLGLDG